MCVEHVDGGQAVAAGLCECTDAVPYVVPDGGADVIPDGVSFCVADGVADGVPYGIPDVVTDVVADGVPYGIPDVYADDVTVHVSDDIPDGVSDGVPYYLPYQQSYIVPNSIPDSNTNTFPNILSNCGMHARPVPQHSAAVPAVRRGVVQRRVQRCVLHVVCKRSFRCGGVDVVQ